ncbi:MAG: flagellar filament capping protein FliD [Helicobacteraceae bacterium]|nr:flagellar filament capping protein FliD [Helicobacteraceae bacterium]
MAISSLGIGSGVLTSDIIEKLKANDEKNTIDPIRDKITVTEAKEKSMELLTSLVDTLQTSVSSLGDSALYQSTSTTVTGDAATVEAIAGVSVQSFELEVTQLAKTDVVESGTFASATSLVAGGAGTMSIAVGGTTYDVDYDASDTLTDLKGYINEEMSDSLTASILQVGTDDYRLILTSKDSGVDEKIIVSDSSGGNLKNALLSEDATIQSSVITKNGTGSDVTVSGANFTINNGDGTETPLAEDIEILAGSTADEVATLFKDAINKLTSTTGVVANIITKSGEPYLYLTNTNDTADATDNDITINVSGNALTYSGFSDGQSVTHDADAESTNIQESKDAKFIYNGINIERTSNTITDLSVGITINLLKEKDSANNVTGIVNVDISQDTEEITTEMENFVTAYNEVAKQISSMTQLNDDDKTQGLFRGDNTLSSVIRTMNNIITRTDSNGNSLINFGTTSSSGTFTPSIDIDRSGVMSFNSSVFESTFNDDPTAAETLFVGGTITSYTGIESREEGTFAQLKDSIKDMLKDTGSIGGTDSGLALLLKTLQTDQDNSILRLNDRYDTMTARFVQYDGMISKINSNFSTLSAAISAANN